VPGVDGSSKPFVEALQSVGTTCQDRIQPRLVVTDVTRVGDADSWIEARPTRGQKMRLKYRLDYGSDNIIGRETLEMTYAAERFAREIAPARTFILRHEAEWLRGQGLAKRVTPRDVLVFDDEGVIDNELRYEDECVRHKMLDMIGDLALSGCDLVGSFVAHRSGHRLNASLVKALMAEFQVDRDRRDCA
jgi:UDP-3-O-acyl-N-acetylglucosamine deacetylase